LFETARSSASANGALRHALDAQAFPTPRRRSCARTAPAHAARIDAAGETGRAEPLRQLDEREPRAAPDVDRPEARPEPDRFEEREPERR
jgi:hypothetical protein